jgi:hypothetical protein
MSIGLESLAFKGIAFNAYGIFRRNFLKTSV